MLIKLALALPSLLIMVTSGSRETRGFRTAEHKPQELLRLSHDAERHKKTFPHKLSQGKRLFMLSHQTEPQLENGLCSKSVKQLHEIKSYEK